MLKIKIRTFFIYHVIALIVLPLFITLLFNNLYSDSETSEDVEISEDIEISLDDDENED